MKLLMESWKKFINESTFAEKAEKAKEIYAQYWEKADPYAEPGEELPPDIELDGSEEAMQVGFALSHLKLLLAREENPSKEEIIKAIHDGWDEGSYEYAETARDYDD
tara:strand:+ start:249 stop:569 length:321 start_codon:yes stop_codon:yes gene_type:complete